MRKRRAVPGELPRIATAKHTPTQEGLYWARADEDSEFALDGYDGFHLLIHVVGTAPFLSIIHAYDVVEGDSLIDIRPHHIAEWSQKPITRDYPVSDD